MLQDLINDSFFSIKKTTRRSTLFTFHRRLLQRDPITEREDDTICQLDEDILRRLKALRPFCSLKLKELIEAAQLLLPREEIDRLLNTYVISDYGHRLLTDPPPPLVVTPTDTRKPPKRYCPVFKTIAPIS